VLVAYIEGLDQGEIQESEWEFDRLAIFDWLDELEFDGDEAQSEAVARCRELLEQSGVGEEFGTEESPAQFDACFLELRRKLEVANCLSSAEPASRVGLIELAGTSTLADVSFYCDLLQHLLTELKPEGDVTIALQAWQNTLHAALDDSVVPTPEVVIGHRRQVLAARNAMRQTLISNGPTSWPALNAVLNSGDALGPALEWFSKELGALTTVPEHAKGAMYAAALEVQRQALKLQKQCSDYLEEPFEGVELAEFRQELQEEGELLKQAFEVMNQASLDENRICCIGCGHANELSRNLCGKCGQRLPRNMAESQVNSLLAPEPQAATVALPRDFQALVDAMDGAQAGDWSALENELQTFVQKFERWCKQIQMVPIIKDASIEIEADLVEKVSVVRESVDFLVSELDAISEELNEAVRHQTTARFSDIRDSLESAAGCMQEVQSLEISRK
jgi:hypothetical protein